MASVRAGVTRILRSPRNLLGLTGATGSFALFLVGVLDQWWWAVALSCYAGAWLVPLKTTLHKIQPAPAKLSTVEGLAWLQENALDKLPASARDVLADIIARAQELMPRLKELESVGLVQVENRVALKQTVKVFLPQAVQAYLRLPTDYARNERGANGLTAEDLLISQLRLMQDHVRELQERSLAEDVDALLAQSRYLNEKFAKPLGLLEEKR